MFSKFVRNVSLFVALAIVSALLLPSNVGAQSSNGVTLNHSLFMPMVVAPAPEMVQFSVGFGALRIVEVGQAFPLRQDQNTDVVISLPDVTTSTLSATVFGGIVFNGWNIATHMKDINGYEGQFQFNMGYQSPFLIVKMNEENGTISLTRDGEIFAMNDQPLKIDGWTVERYLDGFHFRQGASHIWITTSGQEMILEARIPLEEDGWFGCWGYALTNHTFPADPEPCVIARYTQ